MKKSEIKNALTALKSIKMPKLEDKDFRNDLIADHIFLLGQQKKLEADVKDLEIAHLGAYEDERNKVAELQQRFQAEKDADKRKALSDEINSHTELFKAILGYNKAVEALANEEIVLPRLFKADKFVEAMENQDYDLGMVEAVFPMFETN